MLESATPGADKVCSGWGVESSKCGNKQRKGFWTEVESRELISVQRSSRKAGCQESGQFAEKMDSTAAKEQARERFESDIQYCGNHIFTKTWYKSRVERARNQWAEESTKRTVWTYFRLFQEIRSSCWIKKQTDKLGIFFELVLSATLTQNTVFSEMSTAVPTETLTEKCSEKRVLSIAVCDSAVQKVLRMLSGDNFQRVLSAK